ncbi:MAG TPA: NAD-dependent deacylase [Deltaproteobacteria bacterium]|nr:NAD-dependent deacylase [Deltaproteobacteria bacterium]
MISRAASVIRKARHVTAFTGAGISVESGIPPFRGKDGLWNKYDPSFLDIGYFNRNPEKSWRLIKEIFYDFFGSAGPNKGHFALAEMEKRGFVKAVITQNIDNLHQKAGSMKVYELHGTSRTLTCMSCSGIYEAAKIDLAQLPPRCPACSGILKPDFVFFGEPLPQFDYSHAIEEANLADVFLVIGTTGEIMPASVIPHIAKRNGATIIEVNPEGSSYQSTITDIFLRGKAGVVLPELVDELFKAGA